MSDIIDSRPDTIHSFVAQQALEYRSPEEFFTDLLKCGCAKGVITALINHADILAFYDIHVIEIERIRQRFAELDIVFCYSDNPIDSATWSAVEVIAAATAHKLGLTKKLKCSR